MVVVITQGAQLVLVLHVCMHRVPAVVERDSNIYTAVNCDGTVLWMPRVNYRVLAEEQESGEINGKIK